MLVDRVLPMTRTRLVTVGYDAPMLKAAQLLGMTFRSLRYRIKKLGIE